VLWVCILPVWEKEFGSLNIFNSRKITPQYFCFFKKKISYVKMRKIVKVRKILIQRQINLYHDKEESMKFWFCHVMT
jgi:hypothetical protein